MYGRHKNYPLTRNEMNQIAGPRLPVFWESWKPINLGGGKQNKTMSVLQKAEKLPKGFIRHLWEL